jgi:hypothetical protein
MAARPELASLSVYGFFPCRFVDPADPTVVYLSDHQPVDDASRLASAPRYAANYGEDEAYEPMDGPATAPPGPAQGQPLQQR